MHIDVPKYSTDELKENQEIRERFQSLNDQMHGLLEWTRSAFVGLNMKARDMAEAYFSTLTQKYLLHEPHC